MAIASPAQTSFLEDYGNTAPAVPEISQAVNEWRDKHYPGATETSRALLNYWFQSDHRLRTGAPFEYYAAQRKAIESLVYVYEVAKVRNRISLYQQFVPQDRADEIRFPRYDAFARYCAKMATGSGKTKVMALAVVVLKNWTPSKESILDAQQRKDARGEISQVLGRDESQDCVGNPSG